MERSLSRKIIATLVLRALFRHQSAATLGAMTLDALAASVDLPRTDVRRVVSDLHREGHVDALRMRLTASGFVLGLTLERAGASPQRSLFAATIAAA